MQEKHWYGLDDRTEQCQTRALVNFFSLNAIGSVLKCFMLKSYRRNGARYSLYHDQRVCFEGLLIGLSLRSGEIVLSLVEEHIWRDKSYRHGEIVLTESVYMKQNVHLELKNVAWVEVIKKEPIKDFQLTSSYKRSYSEDMMQGRGEDDTGESLSNSSYDGPQITQIAPFST